MTSVSPAYQPGAVVNGHYLATDYRWYPVPRPAPQPVVVNNNGGVSVAVWIIAALVALVTFPLWMWFIPLAVVLAALWGIVYMYVSIARFWGIRALVISLAIPAVAIGILALLANR